MHLNELYGYTSTTVTGTLLGMSVFSDRRPEAHRLPQTEHVSDAS